MAVCTPNSEAPWIDSQGCAAPQKQLRRMKAGTNRSPMKATGECPVPQPRGCGNNPRHQHMLATTMGKEALQDRTLGSLVGKQLNVSSKEPLWQIMTTILGCVQKNTASKSREILRPHLEWHPLLWASLCMMDMEEV